MLVRTDREDISLRRYWIADLQILEENASHLSALLKCAQRIAVKDRVHVLESIGFNAFKREALKRLGPFQRKLPAWTFYYKVLNPSLKSDLDAPQVWDPCPFDGDAVL